MRMHMHDIPLITHESCRLIGLSQPKGRGKIGAPAWRRLLNLERRVRGAVIPSLPRARRGWNATKS